jgi:hypothetical protein
MSKKIDQAPHLAALIALGIKTGNTVEEVKNSEPEEVISPILAWFGGNYFFKEAVINDVAIVVINYREDRHSFSRFDGSFPAVFIDPDITSDNQIRIIIKAFDCEAGFLLSKRDTSLMSHSRDAFRALIKSSVIDCLNELTGK